MRTTISATHRSNVSYYTQLAQSELLAWGTALYNTRFPTLSDANQFVDATVAELAQMAEAFDAVEKFYRDRGLRCRRWTPAVGQPIDALEPFLREKHWRRVNVDAMVLPCWPDPAKNTKDLRILPARAMRDAFRATVAAPGDDAAAAMERLNDPQFDMFVAVRDAEPVGHGALLQVGDIGRVKDLYVVPAARRSGGASALLGHIIALAKRLQMQIVCLEVNQDNPAAKSLFERAGFAVDGTTAIFEAPPVP